MCDKATIHPEKLASGAVAPLENPDLDRLIAELSTQGVECWSPLAVLRGIAERESAYLRQDTHWTPAAMDAVADALAAHLALPAAREPRAWTTRPAEASRVGDLVDTLKLTADQSVFAPQTVEVSTVHGADGQRWAPRRDAEVLLLGDSFTNIYTAEQMGWGQGAGFGARLALHLGRDLDVIAINGAGASGTRAELARAPERLLGKRLVIWQFSARDLAVSDWKVLPIVVPASAPEPATTHAGSLEVNATITVLSHVPAPGGLPYADALTTVRVRIDQVVRGALDATEILVVLPCMRDFKLLPAAGLRQGQSLRLTLVPWSSVEGTHGGTKRYDDTDVYDLPELWVESYDPR